MGHWPSVKITEDNLSWELYDIGLLKSGISTNRNLFRHVKLIRESDGLSMDFMECNKHPAHVIIHTFDLDFLKNYYHQGQLFIHNVDSILCKSSVYSYVSDGYGDTTSNRINKYTKRGFTISNPCQIENVLSQQTLNDVRLN